MQDIIKTVFDNTIQSIFELIRIEYSENKPKYPSFEVEQSRIGLFSNLVKAEQAIKKHVKDCGRKNIFGFLIKEFNLDQCTYWWTISQRNYLPNGSLLDENLIPIHGAAEILNTEFLGRPADKVRFHAGDLVEVLFGDTVTLEIVGAPPPSPEWVSERKKTYGNFRLDSSDDSYYTLGYSENENDDTHSHPQAVDLFPVRFSVSDELKSNLVTRYEACFKETSKS